MSNMSVNNVVCLFDRQPYVAPIAGEASDAVAPNRVPLDILSRYAEVAEDEAKSAAGLMTPALGVARKTREALQHMVASDVRDAIDTLSAFHDAATTTKVLLEVLQTAESRLSFAISAATHQQTTGA